MSLNPNRSRQARIASLVRQARSADAANRVAEAISLLREVAQLDPHDRRTLHWLGNLFRIRLGRLREAATWYAREARSHEREGFAARALAAWLIVLQCDSLHVEAHERVGGLYVEAGRLVDARKHYERSERVLRDAGLGRDASILRALREAIEEPAAPAPAAPAAPAVPATPPAAESHDAAPDADALGFASERLRNARFFRHLGLGAEARRHLEELLSNLPEHVEARQLLVEVCRTLGDEAAAAHHLGVLVHVMRRHGQAPAPAEPVDLLPVEEWEPEESDPFAQILDDLRDDLERLVDGLQKTKEGH